MLDIECWKCANDGAIRSLQGTGIVSSVPSDSPDDFAAFRDLKNKQPFRYMKR